VAVSAECPITSGVSRTDRQFGATAGGPGVRCGVMQQSLELRALAGALVGTEV